MNILGSKVWLWVNAIGLILVGGISLVPNLVPPEFGIPLSIVKIIVAFLTLLSAFWESDATKVNSKIWLVSIGLILLVMGVIPFFNSVMGMAAELPQFLNSLKVILGAITFIVIYVDYYK